jgi:outer membrane protein assembly factor BamA
VIDTVLIAGNRTTKNFVIRNELPVASGDTIKKSDLEDLKILIHDNVFNTGLFNYVYVEDSILPQNKLLLKVRVEERWYVWPYPILEHADINFTNFLFEENWNRVNYGIMLMWYNFRGRRDMLKVKFREGYKKQYGFTYLNPYLFKSRKFAYFLEFNLNVRNEIPVKVAFNRLVYITGNNLYRDWHVGGFFRFRNNLFSSFYLKMNYHNANINYSDSNLVHNFQYNDIELSYVYDRRNIKYFPTEGFFFLASSSTRLNQKEQGTRTFVRLLDIDFRKYFNMGSKWYSSFRLFYNNLFYQDKLAVFDMDYLTSNNIRNYEIYILPMTVAIQSELKYNLVPLKIKKLNFIKSYKFNKPFFSVYTGLFADAGYRLQNINSQNDDYKFLYSAGISLYLVTYYDKLVRVAAGINSFKEYVLSVDFVASF